MPVAPNPLLQASLVNKAPRPAAGVAEKPQQGSAAQGAGFDQVMAGQGRDAVPARDAKPARGAAQANAKESSEPAASGKQQDSGAPSVADGGKGLPGDVPAQATSDTDDAHDQDPSASLDASLVAGQVTDAQPGAQLLQAQAEAVAPVLQAAVQPALQPAPPATSPQEAEKAAAFDPDADPLADMPTLRLALEQDAKAKGTTSAHAAVTRLDNGQPPAADTGAASVNTLANLVEKAEGEAGHAEHGDKAFAGLIDDGLKDLKGASSDTRVDDFANRLASLTQAATAKTANAVPVTPSPLQQPLAMNQGAWTEGLVNRVMYLSSQNLKSADIQLEPAELGRLDIRVNVAADQPTQIHFVSGHAGVRDALDSQVHRLRELFTQQGLAQPDVSVADQSRGQQQQQAQQGESGLSGVAARRAQAAGEGGEPASAAQPLEHQVVVGDSAVDYYA
ncbi:MULTISPECIES: flagellar hook-length control protein FliK [unclassified Pseudomonas]|uniref:flagellar hook-length control protein FliK n=1 Tax=unclassified Pseudomonas TaxID=196821 RepID=UPI0024498596|nr:MULTISPECIES: flagellar hook-length control protein FliK [unclassified Pseudomonas]MDH0300298.1 flagellar hook-length control protein FliK [Pseudomonas sp. GD04091]MDH1986040.1 flagellar hook-length control protein FliK [Pseudomonas sp. GD03689]